MYIFLFYCATDSKLCGRLKDDDEIVSVAINPTRTPDTNPTTIVRHTVPKAIHTEEPHFEVTLTHRSVACDMIVSTTNKKELCKPCASASSTVKSRAKPSRAKPLQPQQNPKLL